jgi:hypothetical protein
VPGAKQDMPDDMLKDAIETSRRVLEKVTDFETEGNRLCLYILFTINK